MDDDFALALLFLPIAVLCMGFIVLAYTLIYIWKGLCWFGRNIIDPLLEELLDAIEYRQVRGDINR